VIMKPVPTIRSWCIAVCFFAVCSAQVVYSQGQRKEILSGFYRGNLLYEKAEYAEAIKEYQRILGLGYESSALYYNLGNSYVKQGRLPEAALNYEKALRLAPRDRDIQANYSYVWSLLQSNGSERKPRGMLAVILYMFKMFSIDELTIIMSFLYWLLVIIIIFTIVGKLSRQKCLIAVAVILTLLSLAGFAFGQRIGCIGKEAIVLEKNLDVRFEPFETATVYFELPAGSKVDLISCRNDWCKIERADGKKGWVKKQGLGIF